MKIIGTGSFLPRTVVTNDELAEIVNTSHEWIYQRVGITKRHVVKEETTVAMAAAAAQEAIHMAGFHAMEIQLIIVATLSPDNIMPSTACEVQAQLGAEHALAFDINAACSGFVLALIMAHAFFNAGIYENALIIGVETLSKIVDWKDRKTCILFGDGGGAVMVQKDNTPFFHVQYCNGKKGEVLSCTGKEVVNPFITRPTADMFVHMDGRQVYKFATQKVPESIREVLVLADVKKEQVKYFILHQANMRIIQSVAEKLELEQERFLHNLETVGNTSSASIPILLAQISREGKLRPGDKLILSGFGGGLTWTSILLEW